MDKRIDELTQLQAKKGDLNKFRTAFLRMFLLIRFITLVLGGLSLPMAISVELETLTIIAIALFPLHIAILFDVREGCRSRIPT